MINDEDQSNKPTGGDINPFLNPFEQPDSQTIECDITEPINDKLDRNNNLNEINDLTEKLDTGLTVDSSPLPGCPPSSPFTTGNEEISSKAQDSASDSNVTEAINILNSEN